MDGVIAMMSDLHVRCTRYFLRPNIKGRIMNGDGVHGYEAGGLLHKVGTADLMMGWGSDEDSDYEPGSSSSDGGKSTTEDTDDGYGDDGEEEDGEDGEDDRW